MINHLKQLETIKGIIQIGANSGQEVPLFNSLTENIILVEPIPQLAEQLKKQYSNILIIDCAVGSTDTESIFHIASNNGESSSILTPKDHKLYYPNILFNDTINVKLKRFDTLIRDYKINMNNYNILVSDTQGYDLDVIKGFGNYLINIDLIICEYINSNLYENNASIKCILDYLSPLNFKLITQFDETLGAGNAVFKRNTYS